MTSQQIEYVLTLAELRSFSKAAKKLYVTQPSLTQYISNLEKQLGLSLFDRSTSPIRLTAAGEVYIAAAQKMKDLEDDLTNELYDLMALKKGTLKIGTSSFRASYLLAKSITAFHAQYPAITISIMEDSMENLLALIQQGKLDLVIGTYAFDYKTFHVEDLAPEQLYLALPPTHPLNDTLKDYRLTASDIKNNSLQALMSPPIDLSLLQDVPFICTTEGEYPADLIRTICETAHFKPRTLLEVKTLDTLFALTLSGLGLSFIPDTLIRFGNFYQHPYYYALNHPLCKSTISLVSRRNGYFSKIAMEYSLLLKQLISIGTWRINDDN